MDDPGLLRLLIEKEKTAAIAIMAIKVNKNLLNKFLSKQPDITLGVKPNIEKMDIE